MLPYSIWWQLSPRTQGQPRTRSLWCTRWPLFSDNLNSLEGYVPVSRGSKRDYTMEMMSITRETWSLHLCSWSRQVVAWKSDIVGAATGQLALPMTAPLVWVLDALSPSQIRPVLFNYLGLINGTSTVRWQSSELWSPLRYHWNTLKRWQKPMKFPPHRPYNFFHMFFILGWLDPSYLHLFVVPCSFFFIRFAVKHKEKIWEYPVICDTLWIQSKCWKNVRNSLRRQRLNSRVLLI